MSPLTIQLDDETLRKVEMAARKESLSPASWAMEQLTKAAEARLACAWDHLSAFAGGADETFAPPSREGSSRPIPSLDS